MRIAHLTLLLGLYCIIHVSTTASPSGSEDVEYYSEEEETDEAEMEEADFNTGQEYSDASFRYSLVHLGRIFHLRNKRELLSMPSNLLPAAMAPGLFTFLELVPTFCGDALRTSEYDMINWARAAKRVRKYMLGYFDTMQLGKGTCDTIEYLLFTCSEAFFDPSVTSFGDRINHAIESMTPSPLKRLFPEERDDVLLAREGVKIPARTITINLHQPIKYGKVVRAAYYKDWFTSLYGPRLTDAKWKRMVVPKNRLESGDGVQAVAADLCNRLVEAVKALNGPDRKWDATTRTYLYPVTLRPILSHLYTFLQMLVIMWNNNVTSRSLVEGKFDLLFKVLFHQALTALEFWRDRTDAGALSLPAQSVSMLNVLFNSYMSSFLLDVKEHGGKYVYSLLFTTLAYPMPATEYGEAVLTLFGNKSECIAFISYRNSNASDRLVSVPIENLIGANWSTEQVAAFRADFSRALDREKSGLLEEAFVNYETFKISTNATTVDALKQEFKNRIHYLQDKDAMMSDED